MYKYNVKNKNFGTKIVQLIYHKRIFYQESGYFTNVKNNLKIILILVKLNLNIIYKNIFSYIYFSKIICQTHLEN